jgi:hypothetical protein
MTESAVVPEHGQTATAADEPPRVTPERIRRFEHEIAERSLQEASGRANVKRLRQSGLSPQDSESAVRQYYLDVASCFLGAVRTVAREQALRFDEVFLELQRAMDDPATRADDVQVDLDRVEAGTDYCILVAGQRAGLG